MSSPPVPVAQPDLPTGGGVWVCGCVGVWVCIHHHGGSLPESLTPTVITTYLTSISHVACNHYNHSYSHQVLMNCGCWCVGGEEGKGKGERGDKGWWSPSWLDSPVYNLPPHSPKE